MVAVLSCLFILLSVLGMPSECSPGDKCSTPSFMSTNAKPAVLIILDNSNSMDETFNATAVGSYCSTSKSVKAREALIDMINTYGSKLNIGVMGYKISTPSNSYYLYNSAYFASYQPKSYCPEPPAACQSWCNSTQNSTFYTYRNACQSNCSSQTGASAFNATYMDEIITNYKNTPSVRGRYCSLVYPKTVKIATGLGNHIYTKGLYALYWTNYGSGYWSPTYPYCYATSYDVTDGASHNYFTCYQTKTGNLDNKTGYGTAFTSYNPDFVATDSDWALGFGNFGRRMDFLNPTVGQTWYYSAGSSGNPSRGYLYVPVGNATAGSSTYNRLMYKLATKVGNATGYVKSSCAAQSSSNSSSNTCHIINSGLTPSYGALKSAYDYFRGTFNNLASPIASDCQSNYVLYVTDGLPSVNSTGYANARYPDQLMPEVLTQLRNLRKVPYPTGKNSTVLTYILGVGLQDQAKTRLDQMAAAGGTNASNNGHAFYADNATQLMNALAQIFAAMGQTSGSAGAVATVSQEISTGDVVVRGAFKAYNNNDTAKYLWKGHLESYWPYEGCVSFTTNSTCSNMTGCTWVSNGTANKCNGTIYSFQLAANSNSNGSLFCKDSAFQGDNCTDAGYTLSNSQQASGRTIFTRVNNAWTLFNATNFHTLRPYLPMNQTFGGCNSNTNGSKKALINWVRGVNVASSRNRSGWLLGDIVYSTPVVVGAPSVASVPRTVASAGCALYSNSTRCFSYFQDRHLYRDQMVYVGANDGMLHAFTLGKYNGTNFIFDPDVASGIGRERWAYIPGNLLSSLQDIAVSGYGTQSCCAHRYMVDLSPQSWSVKLYNSTLNDYTWRTVLLGGERDGGDVYFSLDVTNPATGNSTNGTRVLYEHSVLKNFPGPKTINSTKTTIFNGTTLGGNYDYLKIFPLTRSLPYMARLGPASDNSTRYVAISGGGIREFQPGLARLGSTSKYLTNCTGWYYLYYPTFRAVAMNGTDLWNGVWTTLLADTTYKNYFRVSNSTVKAGSKTFVMPRAVSNTAAFDVFGSDGKAVSMDGTADGSEDVVYAGDVGGAFYTLALKGKTQNSTSDAWKPRSMAVRKTKEIASSYRSSNTYRGTRQPISVTPVAAYDSDGNLRVYFGTGKFDEVVSGSKDDKSDNATMSFYCLVENLNSTINCTSATRVSSLSSLPVYAKCNSTGANNTWVRNSTTPSGDACFKCSFDFTTQGERVTDSALVAGGYVFFTTFVPHADTCASGGNSSLYVVDYECKPITGSVIGGATQTTKITNSQGVIAALKVALGEGMASRPVLDSSGTSLLIQTSENKLIRIAVDLTGAIRSTIRGWNTGPYSSNNTKP